MSPADFRPISVLSVLCIVFELIVVRQYIYDLSLSTCTQPIAHACHRMPSLTSLRFDSMVPPQLPSSLFSKPLLPCCQIISMLWFLHSTFSKPFTLSHTLYLTTIGYYTTAHQGLTNSISFTRNGPIFSSNGGNF